MISTKKHYIVAIVTLILIITYLHYSTVPRLHSLHDIYRAFYYIPALFAAFLFGLKGAFLTYLLILVLYVPYIYISWTGIFVLEADRLLHLLLQGLISIFAGFFIDRDRRQRDLVEKEQYLAGIGQVATTIVHDLKNPLITILGFTRRIREGKGNIDTATQAITESAQQIQRIVNDVMDFAKPIKLELKEENIRNVINRAYDSCKIKAEGQGVNITIDLPADPVNIAIDSFHLERAIVNLINNAIEASHKGQNIEIVTASEKNYLVIRIKDKGSGMDRETLQNIFIPFYSKKSGGTGLGMPISKKIIEEHKGKIHVDSKPDQGTEVTIRLPCRLTGKKEK